MKYLLLILMLLAIPVVMANSVDIILNDGSVRNINCNLPSNQFVCYNPSITYTQETMFSQMTCGSTQIYCDNFLNDKCIKNSTGTWCCDSMIGTVEQCDKPVSDNSSLIIGGVIIVVIGGLVFLYKKSK